MCLNIAFILANVIAGDKFENVQHPVVDINSICEASLPLIHQIDQMVPHLSHLLDPLLDLLTAKVSLLNKFISTTNGDLESRLVASNLRLQSLVFGQQEVDGGKVMTNVGLEQDVLHLLDPVLLLGHVPIELPQQSGLFQPGSSLHSKFNQFCIGVLKSLDSLDNNGWVAWSVAI